MGVLSSAARLAGRCPPARNQNVPTGNHEHHNEPRIEVHPAEQLRLSAQGQGPGSPCQEARLTTSVGRTFPGQSPLTHDG